MTTLSPIAGCILAGGQSRRMGEDKTSLTFDGKPLIGRAVERLKPQVSSLIINAHDDSVDFDAYGLAVVADSTSDRQGPLAGIQAALHWARTNKIDWIATVAIDTPFFPNNLVARLSAAARNKDMATAASGGRLHPVFGLWPARLASELERHLDDGLRSAHEWVALHDAGIAEWPAEPYDPFFNINRPEDVTAALRILAEFQP